LVAFLPRGRHHCHELFQIFMFNSSWLMHWSFKISWDVSWVVRLVNIDLVLILV
jgi:hypothetical protein